MEDEDFTFYAQCIVVAILPFVCALIATLVFRRRVQRPWVLMIVSTAFLYLLYVSIIFIPLLSEYSHPNFIRAGPPVTNSHPVSAEEVMNEIRYWVLRAFARPMITIVVLTAPAVWVIQRFFFSPKQQDA